MNIPEKAIYKNRNQAPQIALYGTMLLAGYAALHGGGFSAQSRWIVAFVASAFLLLVLADKKRTYRLPPIAVVVVWSIFLIWTAVATAFSANPDASVGEVLMFAGLCIAGFFAYSLPQNEAETFRAIFLLFLGIAAVTVFGWVIYLIGRFGIEGGHDMIRHFIGPFFWKNPMAGYFILTLPVALALALHCKRLFQVLAAVLSVLMMSGLILTRSRGGWIAFIIALAVVFVPSLIAKRIALKKWLLLGAIMLSGIALGLILAPSKAIAQRAESISTMISPGTEGQSAVERVAMLEAGIEIIRDYPIFGVGPRAWPAVRAAYLTGIKFLPRFPHNAYLRTAAETGIPGLILLIIALAITLIPLIKNSFSRTGPILLTGIAAGLLSIMLHVGVDFDAAFAGILLPSAILVGFGFGLIRRNAISSTIGEARTPLIILGFLTLCILFSRSYSNIKLYDSRESSKRIEYKTALKQGETAVAFNPISWESRYNLYDIYMELRRPETALIEIISALRLAPTIPDLHLAEARVQAVLGDTAASIGSYRNAIAYAPCGSAEAYLELGRLLRDIGRHEESIGVLVTMTETLAPFSGQKYTARTADYRFKTARAWGMLDDIYIEIGDTLMHEFAAQKVGEYSTPRKIDYPLRKLGLESPTPELTVFRFFDALESGDTTALRELVNDKVGAIPKTSAEKTFKIAEIRDVFEDPVGEKASVEIILFSEDTSGFADRIPMRVNLVLNNGKWAVFFGKRP